jgi:hypothetical protein
LPAANQALRIPIALIKTFFIWICKNGIVGFGVKTLLNPKIQKLLL